MKTRVEKFKSDNLEFYHQAVAIRQKVFIEEQNVDAELEMEFEEESIFFLMFADKEASGTARYRIIDEKIKLERFAILPQFRGKGLGNVLIRAVLNDTVCLQRKIYLNSQHQVVDYYRKWGFEIVGDSFTEANILHYKMEFNPQKYEELKRTEHYLKAICRR